MSSLKEPELASQPLPRAERLAWLRLIRTDSIGPVTFSQLIGRFSSAQAAIDALPALSRKSGLGSALQARPLGEAEDELAALERLGARLVCLPEPSYPVLLRHIPAPPPVVAIRGGDGLDWSRTVGIVGARNASAAGQRMAQLLAKDLGRAGYLIISGLARGIDAAAHRASLATGTVGVLAGGLDRVYPDENKPLAEAILDNGGALITEMPLGLEPRARDFPRRNRLISGLSLGIVVVEAAKRSGSLITARLALEQNRDVFAVPGSPLDQRAEGANHLIQQGASLVTSAADILRGLGQADPRRNALFESDNQDFGNWVDADPGPDARDRLLSALSVTPVPVDDLVQQTGLSVAQVQALLLDLDLAGSLERSSGQLVALKG